MLWPMKLLDLVVWIFVLVILSESTVEGVTRFGRFLWGNFREPMSSMKQGSLFCWALPPHGQRPLHWIQLLEVLPY
jgi:hypothetical protein